MITWMKNVDNFQIKKFIPRVFLSICQIFAIFSLVLHIKVLLIKNKHVWLLQTEERISLLMFHLVGHIEWILLSVLVLL